MFTGIIEALGKVENIIEEDNNLKITVSAPFLHELKIDQSVAHNGICLTVNDIYSNTYEVIAIAETIRKSNIKNWNIDTFINLERCLIFNGRIDGHLVQGHVDSVAKCIDIQDHKGSWEYLFEIDSKFAPLLVDKGSVCVNGISLTVFDPSFQTFKVAIIPYTFEHTNFQFLNIGDLVNIEFDIIGKYFSRYKELKEFSICNPS